MAFPASVSSFNDPTALNKLSSPSHSALHQAVNTDIEAIETKLGTGSSTATDNTVLRGTGAGTSAWGQIDSGDVSSTTGTGAFVLASAPTITAPVFATSADLNGVELILDADGDTSITADTDDQIDIRIAGADDFQFTANTFTALAGSNIVNNGTLSQVGTSAFTGVASFTSHIDINDASTAIRDSSDNELLKFVKTASAVNELTVTNAATAGRPSLSATGGDTNIGLDLITKGTGLLRLSGLNHQAITTNSQPSGLVVQFGWSFIPGTGADEATKTITFPTAFAAAPLYVGVSVLGFDTTTPTAITDFDGTTGSAPFSGTAYTITATNFICQISRSDAVTFNSSVIPGFTWIAIGVV